MRTSGRGTGVLLGMARLCALVLFGGGSSTGVLASVLQKKKVRRTWHGRAIGHAWGVLSSDLQGRTFLSDSTGVLSDTPGACLSLTLQVVSPFLTHCRADGRALGVLSSASQAKFVF
ncbi:hypothetical protein JCGZ_15371 [Jatropha curcas]|uniref:Uncharacterized protein n=1 Tax=Jatropha curcas TaxID=180498 RepID=A0A067KI74_JATCU|nr:hypothetical protein JCGZ_15371 [Jatropha curcas]